MIGLILPYFFRISIYICFNNNFQQFFLNRKRVRWNSYVNGCLGINRNVFVLAQGGSELFMHGNNSLYGSLSLIWNF